MQDRTFANVNDLGHIVFSVGDAETPAGDLVVTAASSDPVLLPAERLSVGGASGSRRLLLAPASGATGTAEITLTVRDGVGATASTTFKVAFLGPGNPHFASAGAVAIPVSGKAAPYPSEVAVGGLGGVVSRVRVSLENLTHDEPNHLGAVLVGPQGQAVALMAPQVALPAH